MNHPSRTATTVATAAAALLLVAGCGGSKSSNTSGDTGSPGLTQHSSGISVDTHSGPMGTYLTDSAGKSLYLFAADSMNKSACSGPCLTYWPPLLTSGSASAGSGVTASQLGTIPAANGKKQVTYNGHPLYYFSEDQSAGDTTGQGSDGFGAKWWLVAPGGSAITAASGGTTTTTSGGGNGWG